jgi:hypothetical protein
VLKYANNPKNLPLVYSLDRIVGTASGVSHLGVRGRKVTYFGDGFELEKLASLIVCHDLFGSLQG